jgi:thioredoxin 1
MFRGLAFTTLQKPMATTTQLPSNAITTMSKDDFVTALLNNQGALVIKFGAEWCGPCKKIDPLVYGWMSQFPATIQGAIIDIDDNFELYALLKSKKLVNGVPAILCYRKGNQTIVPDNVVVGADETQVNAFFRQCMTYA